MSPDAITAAINAAVARVLPAELVPGGGGGGGGGGGCWKPIRWRRPSEDLHGGWIRRRLRRKFVFNLGGGGAGGGGGSGGGGGGSTGYTMGKQSGGGGGGGGDGCIHRCR